MLESDLMSFAVRMASDVAVVEAGATVPVGIEITNRGEEGDTYELQIEGLDPEWAAIPVPSISVGARETYPEKIFLKPPRLSESKAGTYPFVLSVRSLSTGEVRPTQAVLEIKPYHHVSVDVSPKKGSISAMNREAPFQVTVMNLGNSEHTFQMFANDLEDECACEFEQDKVTIGPGQQKTVEMAVSAKRRPLLANPRLHLISCSARSTTAPTVAGTAQAQLEQKALITPGALIFSVILLAIISAWYWSMPRPPQMERLSVDLQEIELGQAVTLSWRASPNAKSVRIVAGDQTFDNLDPSGSRQFTPEEAGTIQISASAIAGERRSNAMTVAVTVKEPPVVPLPRIVSFEITPSKVNLGETVLVKYKLEHATKATLWPTALTLDPGVTERELTPSSLGTINYRLVAENSQGKRVEQAIKVVVVKGSAAKIALFRVEPTTVDETNPNVRITWQTVDAAAVEIKYGEQTERVEASGTIEIPVMKSTTFTLIAYDADGVTITKKAEVTFKAPEPPPTDEGTTDGAPKTTGGTGN